MAGARRVSAPRRSQSSAYTSGFAPAQNSASISSSRKFSTAKVFPPHRRREDFAKSDLVKRANYGVGDAELVLVLELLLEDVPPLGDEPALTVVFVSVLFVVAGEAEGFTTVVLFSVLLSAGGLAVSVFCSHAASNDNDAAPARMQMYFFIVG